MLVQTEYAPNGLFDGEPVIQHICDKQASRLGSHYMLTRCNRALRYTWVAQKLSGRNCQRCGTDADFQAVADAHEVELKKLKDARVLKDAETRVDRTWAEVGYQISNMIIEDAKKNPDYIICASFGELIPLFDLEN